MQVPTECRLERVLQPWEVNPYDPISWFDVLQFSATAFYWIGGLLESLFSDCLIKPGGFGDAPFPPGALNEPLDEKTREKAISSFRTVSEQCGLIGMSITAETAAELRSKIEASPAFSYDLLLSEIKAVRSVMQKEMRGKIFLYLSPERVRFWPKMNEQNVFGERVAKAFPSARFDISEAGICLALARGTAAVFHLMRVLEIGLGVLGKQFDVSLGNRNWAPVIEEIESKIRGMNQDMAWKSLPDCKELQRFYSDAASNFGILKDAWRNNAMHVRGVYTEEQAQRIFENVKSFMQKLAERLSE